MLSNFTAHDLSTCRRVAVKGGGFAMDDYWCWCGSVIAADGRYHMFASRWPKGLPFHPGWLTNSEIVRASADRPEGPYTFEEVVLKPRGNAYWDGDSTHNPRVVKVGDRYVMYYMGSRHPFATPRLGEPLTLQDPRVIVARSNKRIGIATATRITGPWQRLDKPVFEPVPDSYYSFFTSNPAPVIAADGSVTLVFKCRRYLPSRTHSGMMLGVAQAPRPEGPYTVITPEPIFGGPGQAELEDPFAWRSSRGIEMIAKDMSGKICGQSGGGIAAWSPDGKQWHIEESPGWLRDVQWSDGTSSRLGSAERPFVLFENGRPTHLFLAVADGPGGFEHASRTWVQSFALQQ